ncbi:SDR family oxidoreductase [Pseudomonas kuykendallii]|uniref:NAD(P)H dehydrogenase (Quinone) n=1 Tax=Pseudomonas kuykendallii TaxID=1007099 RepID=A0A1H2V954_9PSED|nr:SDR family oxidoreductase [Pseudomonas kuykendallii]MCQ4271267.1 SDR family oxidoreductase [Pseudomonas kuykendallii]SDW64815.1 NAD(P)H dehydrogenase (quinone) [Pseudomonas kuykendallii]
MIVVTGASGQLGRLVIQGLLEKLPAAQVVAAVRDPAKVEAFAALGVQVRQADYDQPSSLERAFAGAEKVLLISSSEVGKRAPQHRAAIAAAGTAGVKLLAYTSLLHADRSPLGLADEHRETEAALADSGVPYVLLRNGWYSENYTAGIPAALQLGALYGCAGEGRIASAGRADYAAAAVAVLTAEQAQAGRVYELAGDTSYSLAELAAEISRQTGKTIPYQDLPQADYQAALQGAGLPDWLAAMLADSDAGASRGALFDDGRQLGRLIGRPTLTLADAVAQQLRG